MIFSSEMSSMSNQSPLRFLGALEWDAAQIYTKSMFVDFHNLLQV